MDNRVKIFNAGPAVLPVDVLKEVQENLVSYKGLGLSVMEMSHRSKEYQAIIDDAMDRAKKLMGLGDDYDILYLQGGASTQFLMVPLNLCPDDKIANYIDTGAWSNKAIKEAKKAGKKMHIAASSEADGYTYIPKKFELSGNPAYLHITTNNTIRGTQWTSTPEVPEDTLLIADMSSDFLSKPMDFNKYDLIYAGAQKNIGPAGTTFVAIRKGLAMQEGLPTMLSYKTHIDKDSMFNTPSCFAIYVVGLVLKWIEDIGGLEAMDKMNQEKAALLYDRMGDFYKCPVKEEDRSLMNVVFRLPSEDLEKKFIADAAAQDMIGLKGHRSVGGCRASIYNSSPLEDVKALAEFMKEFERQNG